MLACGLSIATRSSLWRRFFALVTSCQTASRQGAKRGSDLELKVKRKPEQEEEKEEEEEEEGSVPLRRMPMRYVPFTLV